MKPILYTIVLLFSALSLNAQEVFGKWKSVDDVTGEIKSIVEIYKEGNKVYGKILNVLVPGQENSICENCEGDKKNKPVTGMVIMNDLEKDEDEYNGGTILDPESGKVYKCYIKLVEDDKLKLRGYIGFSALGRTQYWFRTN